MNVGQTTIRLTGAAVLIILLATAVPSGLRDPRNIRWQLMMNIPDVIANVILYVPFGFFIQANRSLLSAMGTAAVLSAGIELAQLFSIRRSAQPVDVAANVIGAVVGITLGRLLGVRSDRVPAGRLAGVIAIAAGIAITAALISVWPVVPRYIARSVVPAVAFLVAAGFAVLTRPERLVAKLWTGAAFGAVIGLSLFPFGRTPVFSVIMVSVLFGIAGVLCVGSATVERNRIATALKQQDA